MTTRTFIKILNLADTFSPFWVAVSNWRPSVALYYFCTGTCSWTLCSSGPWQQGLRQSCQWCSCPQLLQAWWCWQSASSPEQLPCLCQPHLIPCLLPEMLFYFTGSCWSQMGELPGNIKMLRYNEQMILCASLSGALRSYTRVVVVPLYLHFLSEE